MIDINYDYSKVYFEQNKDNSGANGVSDEEQGEEKISLTDIIDLIENGDFDILNSLNVKSITRYTDKSGRSIVSFKYDDIKYTFTVTGVADANKDNIDIDDILESLETGDTSLLDSIGCNYTKASDKSGRIVIIFEYDGIKYSVYINNPTAGSATNTEDAKGTEGGGKTTPTFITFQEADLAGLEQAAIDKYLIKQEDGTYVFNVKALFTDFPDKQITTIEQLKEAIEAQKSQAQTNGFASWNEMHSWLQSGARTEFEAKYKDIRFKTGCQAAANVGNNHKTDFNTISREALLEELHAEYLRLYPNDVIKNTESTDNGDETFADFGKLKMFVIGSEAKEAVEKALGYEISQSDLNNIGGRIAENHRDNPKGVTKTQIIKELVAAFQELKTKGADGSDGIPQPKDFTGKFEHMGQLQTYVHSKDVMDYVFAQAGGKIDQNEYGYLAYEVAQKHEKDISSVTVESIIKELIDAVKAKVTAATRANGTDGSGTDDNTLNTYEALKEYVQSLKSSMTGEPYKTYFDKASTNVLSRHNTAKFQSVTKAQIEAEIKAECEALKKADDDKAAAEDPNTKIKDAASKLRNPIGDVAESIVAVCKEAINYKNSFNVRYSLDANGNIKFTKDSDAEKVFNTILDRLKSRINRYAKDALDAIGGEAMLKKLLQSAWADASSGITYNNKLNTGDFINKVMNNLDMILSKVSTNPEYLDYYTNNCYQDKTLTNGLPNISDNAINYSFPVKYDTGEMHLHNDASDKKFQETMNKLLENIYKKYPNIDKAYLKKIFSKAQENALLGTDIPPEININFNCLGTGKMLDLVNLVLYHFDKLFKADAKNTIFSARTEDAQPRAAQSSQDETKNDNIKTGAQGIMNCVGDVAESIVAVCKEAIGYKNDIHTEFGLDRNGNIVFQEKDTQTVFDTILEKLKSRINRYASDALQKLGGETVLKQLLQAAWITTYNDFNSSQSNDTTKFINKVMDNLEKMLKKLQTNPELMEVFTKRPSYADSSVTKGVKHYGTNTTDGNDETIIYNGTVLKYADGSVHISNTTDDNDYQTTMNSLLQKLIAKYPSLDGNVITQVFRNAQYKALAALQGNLNDCPYGTGNNNGRVEDYTKDWGGKDNRKDDSSKIHMDQLVQMTLYYFDKLIYAELLK